MSSIKKEYYHGFSYSFIASPIPLFASVFKKVSSTTTGCELIGLIPTYLVSYGLAKTFSQDVGAGTALAKVICPLGVFAGLGYSSYYQADKLLPPYGGRSLFSTKDNPLF